MAKSTPVKKTNGGASKKSTPVKTPTKGKKQVDSTRSARSTRYTDSSVLTKRITSAVEQLTKFVANKSEENSELKSQLLGEDDELNNLIQLIVVNNRSYTGNSKNLKLKLVDVKHSMYKLWKEASVTAVKDFKTLLILKDADIKKVSEDELFDQLNESGITVDAIICGKDLKTKYKAYEARRAFISDFSLILADDSIVTLLPKFLGGKAYEKIETTPVSIRTQSAKEFSLKTLTNSIKKVYLNQVPIKLPRGNTLNVHLGKLEWFKNEDLTENVESIIQSLLKSYKIRSIFIKSNNSPVLPLYYNDAVLEEITTKSEEISKDKKNSDLVTIDGVDVHLSAFDKALMEIANPQEIGNIFAKQVSAAKRKIVESESSSEVKSVKKAKK